MISLILFISALALGLGVTRWLIPRLYIFEFAAMTVILGLFLWTWLAFILSLILPYSASVPITVALSLGLGITFWALGHRRQPHVALLTLPSGRLSGIIWSATTFLLVVGLGILFWTHSLITTPTGLYSAGSTWADFGLHSALVTHQAAASHLPMDMPLASGTHLTYPFLIDFLSALYLRGGWSLHFALFLPGLLLTLSILQLVISLSLRLFGKLSAALISLALILLNGSALGFDTAWADWRQSGQNLMAFLGAVPRNYSGVDELNTHFHNIVADILLPQRGFLFGLGIFLVSATLLQIARSQPQTNTRYLWSAAVLIGLLPLAHAHSFIASILLFTTMLVLIFWQHPDRRQTCIIAIAITLTLALPQMAWQTFANNLGTGGHFALGWMRQPDESIWVFWWHNFGPTGLYLIALPFLLMRAAWKKFLPWYLPFLGLLIITQIYSFQPFEYDNLKLILYANLVAMLFAGPLLLELIKRSKLNILFLVPVILVVTIPGALTITREYQLHDQFASLDDQALASWVETDTAPSDVFLTTDRPNHPIASLAGRPIVLGYRGWLYNYHLPYTPRETAVSSALQAQPITNRYNARYLAVGTSESPDWTVNHSTLDTLYPIAYQNPSWKIYQLP